MSTKAITALSTFILLVGLTTTTRAIKAHGFNVAQINEVKKVKMAGANWACPNDNYTDGWLLLSGLKSSDSYADVKVKANEVYSKFISLGVNTVRLPVNPLTVTESWWNSYQATIDEALVKGLKVILCCWEGDTKKDGKIDNMDQFWQMWAVIVNKYGKNPKLYFEIFNEPFGYNKTDWANICEKWLVQYPSVPKNRIIISGTGYSSDVREMGADPRFANCLLALHIYSWFANLHSSSQWQLELSTKLGDHAKRTIVTEYGVNMSSGDDFFGYNGHDRAVSFLQAVTNKLHDDEISSVYWPGYRTGDAFSLIKMENNKWVVNNESGLSQIQYAWGNKKSKPGFKETSLYKIVNKNTGEVLEIDNASATRSVKAVMYNGAKNQQWQLIRTGNNFFKIINRDSSLALEAKKEKSTGDEQTLQGNWNGGDEQQWYYNNDTHQILNRYSGKNLAIKSYQKKDDVQNVQSVTNNSSNQQWEIVELNINK